jgi:hypothetical protein
MNILVIGFMAAFGVSGAQAQTVEVDKGTAAAQVQPATVERGVAQADLEPIEDTDLATPNYSSRSRGRRRRSSDGSFLSMVHFAAIGGYVNTNWRGVNNQAASFSTPASGGTVAAGSGFAVGAQALVGNGQLQFETGVQYADRNISYNGLLRDQNNNLLGYTGTINEDISYIEVPLKARYSFSDPSDSHLFIHAGAVTAFVVNRADNIGNIAFSNTGGVFGFGAPNSASAPGTLGNLNALDLRGAAGLGGELKIQRGVSLTIQGEYEHSLMKINSSGTDSIMVEGFGAYAGATFDF